MLLDDEREWLALPATNTSEIAPPETVDLIVRLEVTGRAYRFYDPIENSFRPRNTAMGDKALRIDALIRQWGYRP